MLGKQKNVTLALSVTAMLFCGSLAEASEYLGSFTGGGFSRDIVINGDYGYVANGFNGLQILDLRDSGRISLLKTVTPAYVPGRSTYNLLLDDNYLYMTDRTGGLLTYDVSDPGSPALLSTNLPEHKANTLAKYKGTLFMGEVLGGMVAFDVQDPGQPVEIGRIKIPNEESPKEAQGMAFKDNYAFVANPWDGLAIVNISNTASMTLEGYYHKPADAFPGVWDVVVNNDYAFIIAQRYGIQSLNISDPANPFFVSELLLPVNYMEGNDSPPLDIKLINGHYSAVTNGYDGVYILDISDPTHITIAENIDTTGYAWGTRVHGNRLYIADGYDGIHAYDISEYTSVPLPSTAFMLLSGLFSLGTAGRLRMNGQRRKSGRQARPSQEPKTLSVLV